MLLSRHLPLFVAKALLLLVLGLMSLALHADPPPAPIDNTPFIRTPPAPHAPRINGPRVYGARAGHPILYYVPVTGDRPIQMTAEGLPDGVKLDAGTGIITGLTTDTGEHAVTLKATNSIGSDTITWKLVIGNRIDLTPQMGWNSWDCFRKGVMQKNVEDVADRIVSSGLINHGWSFVNLDEGWEGQRDAQGVLEPKKEFPDILGLSASLHARGLKLGIYSSPGPLACGGSVATYGYEDKDAATWASWGIDYLKYDWCTYSSIASLERARLYAPLLSPDDAKSLLDLGSRQAVLDMLHWGHSAACLPQTDEIRAAAAGMAGWTKEQMNAAEKETHRQFDSLINKVKQANPDKAKALELEIVQAPYIKMRASLDKVPRDIVYSLCQYGMGDVWKWGDSIGANSWRTTGDLFNTNQMDGLGFGRPLDIAQWSGPGHYNDPDMLLVGNGKDGFTAPYLYTHFTQWCMLAAPLIIGSDLKKADAFQISLFCNDEVLAVDQDPLGRQATRAEQNSADKTEVWVKPLEDGGCAVGIYNRGDVEREVAVKWSDLDRTGKQQVRDLWRQKDIGVFPDGYTIKVGSHDAELLRLKGA